jgi:pimeloyl-ACP methyl ester carboxylesterase
MDIILIPGLWLDGSSWDAVRPPLEAAGHRAHALTLPGMEGADVDRSSIGLADHVAAVVAAIDAVDPGAGPVVLVGHSAGAAIAHAALDARPERVARAIYIGGFPTGDGDAIVDGLRVVDGEVPLPAWSDFDAADLGDLDDAARADFGRRAIPSPAGVTTDRQRLADTRRYDVPVTVICPEFTSEALRGWIDQGAGPVRELALIADVELVDLPTGHWPQFTRPTDLAAAILASIDKQGQRG